MPVSSRPIPLEQDHVNLKAFYFTMFEVNPAYAHELRKAFIRN